ncbi:MAG: aldose 1-epimerase family protein [Bacteroidetes bacterium]|nr:aldose 1-epimerase family protein [Bacteroidota bacterium]
MIFLENEKVKIAVMPLGAELCSLYHKQHRLQYLWQAGDAWTKHSPVLFPIVGQLKNNEYIHQQKKYTLPRHGFAREKKFSVFEQKENQITFRLSDDEQTQKNYPFTFHFDIQYQLIKSEIIITYSVTNTGTDKMYFSVGAHPAFRVPLDLRDTYDDYYLEFDQEEQSGQWPLKDGLIEVAPIPFFNSQKIYLTKEIFSNDALVFKKINSNKVHLHSNKHQHGISVTVNQCPFLGIWAAKGADFLCIEPWQGIADGVQATGEIAEKEGILGLEAGKNYQYRWAIELY